jgi:hypothetical protein
LCLLAVSGIPKTNAFLPGLRLVSRPTFCTIHLFPEKQRELEMKIKEASETRVALQKLASGCASILGDIHDYAHY